MAKLEAGSYPHLANLLGGWFHQDFDIEGETMEEVIGAFLQCTNADRIAEVKADIARFLEDATTAGNVDTEFVRVFQPDIDPAGWDMTAAEWLARVDGLLVQ